MSQPTGQFSKVSGYKINIQDHETWNALMINTVRERLRKKFYSKLPQNKYLAPNLAKEVKRLHSENDQTMKDLGENTKVWKHTCLSIKETVSLSVYNI